MLAMPLDTLIAFASHIAALPARQASAIIFAFRFAADAAMTLSLRLQLALSPPLQLSPSLRRRFAISWPTLPFSLSFHFLLFVAIFDAIFSFSRRYFI